MITRTWVRLFAFWSLAVALLMAGALLGSSAWAEPAEGPSLESIKTTLDEIEEAVGRDDVTQEVADQRKELTESFNELDGALKQGRVLSVRIEQLSERVSQKRHALYANELFARTSSALDPFFWSDAFQALPIEIRSARALLEGWLYERGVSARSALAIVISLAIFALAIGLTRWWFPRLHPGHYGTRSAKAWMALWVFLWLAVRTSAASLAVLLVWQAFGLLTFRVEQIAEGLVAGIAAAAFGHGVA